MLGAGDDDDDNDDDDDDNDDTGAGAGAEGGPRGRPRDRLQTLGQPADEELADRELAGERLYRVYSGTELHICKTFSVPA